MSGYHSAIPLGFHFGWFHFPAANGGGAVVFGFWSSAEGRSLRGYAGWVGLRRQGAEPPKSRCVGVTELINGLRSRARVKGLNGGRKALNCRNNFDGLVANNPKGGSLITR